METARESEFPADDEALRSGARLAGYQIVRELGAGTFGHVYLAKHPRLPRYDALKVLRKFWRQSSPQWATRFKREAAYMATLSHPNIVDVYDINDDEGRIWLSMQYIDGTDAQSALRATGGRLNMR